MWTKFPLTSEKDLILLYSLYKRGSSLREIVHIQIVNDVLRISNKLHVTLITGIVNNMAEIELRGIWCVIQMMKQNNTYWKQWEYGK